MDNLNAIMADLELCGRCSVHDLPSVVIVKQYDAEGNLNG